MNKTIETIVFTDLVQSVQEAVQNGFEVKHCVRIGELFHVEMEKEEVKEAPVADTPKAAKATKAR